MLRHLELAFIKIHILHHACREEIYGVGMMEELGVHGYRISPGLLYPTLAKMEKDGALICKKQVVEGKQRKYYRATPTGQALLQEMQNKIIELYKEVVEKI